MKFLPVALIPVYNHPARLQAIVSALRAHGLAVILVDDGSESATAKIIDEACRQADVDCVRLAQNRGKGAAVMAGMEAAHARGFTHALQVDADGQHDLDAVPELVAMARSHPESLISGKPEYDASVPRGRLYGRYITHAWVWLETLSFSIPDSMCGFRVYPLAASLKVAREEHLGRRMDFDTEIMVRLYWRGSTPRFVPVRVIYPPDGVSHFDLWRDNVRITRMHARLFLGMLLRLPRLLAARLRGRSDDGAWARIGERGSLLGLRIVAAATRMLGHRAARLLLAPITLYFLLTNAAARRASRQYLGRVHARVAGELKSRTKPSLAATYRHFHSFSTAVFEKFTAWHAPERLPMARLHGDALLEETIRTGRGMLFFSAHLGNLEICRVLARKHPGLTVNALVYTRNARNFSRFMEEVNPAFNERLILVEHIGPDTALQLRTRLERGEIIVMVADRTPASGNGHVLHADFLGEPAPFATGPYVLAHLLECPVGLMFCLRDEDGTYDVFIEPFAESICLPRRNRREAMLGHAVHFAQRLEYHAVRKPLQWFNFYNFWAEDGGAHEPRPAGTAEMKTNG